MISTHTYSATLNTAPTVTPLSIKGGRVSLDAARWPHVEATITVAVPDPAILALLDPRGGRRVTLTAHAQFAGFAQDRVFDLGIRAMRPNRAGGEVELTLKSDEALLQDYAPLALDAGARASETSLRAVTNYVLSKIGASLQAGAEDANVTAYWAVTNEVINPRAALTATGWQAGSGASAVARVTMTAPLPTAGPYAIQWTAAAGTSNIVPIGASAARMRVTPGKWYVFSAYVCSGTARTAGAAVQFWAAGGSSASKTFYGATVTSDATTFRRVSVIAQCPPGASEAVPFVTTLANAAGNLHYVSMCMWHEGREVVPYFDGATAAGSGYTYEWQDAAHASASSRLPVTERAPELFEWRAGVSAIDFLAPLVQANGFRLVCDEQRRWTLRGVNYIAPGSAVALRYGVNIIDAGEDASRDDDTWYDACVVRYKWTDRDGIQQVREDAYAATTPPTKVRLIEVDGIYPGPGRAQYNVQRAKGRGRTLNLSTVADWSVVVDQNLTATLDGTPIQAGAVESLEYDLSNDRMRVASRTRDVPAGAIELLTGTIAALSGTIATLT